MSDTRIVRSDNRSSELNMSVHVVIETRSMLEALTIASHRGPRDTWTAARDRTARQIGVKPSYAARVWHRWETMKDVSGDAYRSIRAAYDAQCLHNENKVAEHRNRAEEIRNGGPTDQKLSAAAVRLD
jgi:hypothetical protein